MPTPILNMCVLLPFGVNNPASLVTFSVDRPYDTKSEYVKQITFSHIDIKKLIMMHALKNLGGHN